jgi:hypothetical protein
MIRDRILKGMQVIDYAIDNNTSLTIASVKSGYADTYVKNVKRKVVDKFNKKTIDIKDYVLFMDKYDEYLSKCTKQEPIVISLANSKICADKVYAGAQTVTFTDNSQIRVQANPPETAQFNQSQNEQLKFEIQGKVANIEWKNGSNYPNGHIKTAEQLLLAAEIDNAMWKIKKQIVNKWDVTSFKSVDPITIQNFQVKLELERNNPLFEAVNLGEILENIVKSYKLPQVQPSLFEKNVHGEHNLLELSLFDLHIGKLGWNGETGENYDTKIARDRFVTALTTLLKRASSFNYERILFPIGNDFFNSDNMNNTTTHGTPQDEDLRWQKTFEVGVALLADAINLLKLENVPVDVLVIPGNHDFERSFYLGSVLSAWFNNDPQVTIDNGASPRKYYRYHEVLLGFTHGSEEKETSLPLIMANDIESKQLWSQTRFHEWHLGHQHRKKSYRHNVDFNKDTLINEENGVIIRYLSSLTGTEEWHHKKGFIGAVKAADAFIWNDKLGMTAHLNANIPE